MSPPSPPSASRPPHFPTPSIGIKNTASSRMKAWIASVVATEVMPPTNSQVITKVARNHTAPFVAVSLHPVSEPNTSRRVNHSTMHMNIMDMFPAMDVSRSTVRLSKKSFTKSCWNWGGKGGGSK